jgi:hypothetical protein
MFEGENSKRRSVLLIPFIRDLNLFRASGFGFRNFPAHLIAPANTSIGFNAIENGNRTRLP